ncbi:hypothetical protein [Paenibacillus sp. FSL K6-1230]|uniref:hypothetical protein n=1 Tax=Paenibacillus sp. FSL K6-1230 TaxID=2921603 RepID=UPI0030FBBB9C
MIKTVTTTERYEDGNLVERVVEETIEDKPANSTSFYVSFSLPDNIDVTRISEQIVRALDEVVKPKGN